MSGSVENRLKNIASSWFYTQPLLFSVYCNHLLVQNEKMTFPFRSGQHRIEFSPALLQEKNDSQLESLFIFEMYRIILRHPYQRMPFNAQKTVMVLASDVTVYQFYKPVEGAEIAGIEYLKSLSRRFYELDEPLGKKWSGSEEEKFFMRNLNVNRKTGELELYDRLSFEQWYRRILFLLSQISSGGENAGFSLGADNSGFEDLCSLWKEDDLALEQIAGNIQKAEVEEGWGETGGNLRRELNDSCDFSFDYRKALTKFRQGIVNAERSLTRMKPSRRYGFNAMGSRYNRRADILIAVDVSGSVSDESFAHFCRAIKNIFFLGIIKKIDLVFFDVNIKNTTPLAFSSVNKKLSLQDIAGRGGTNFQCAVDFFFEHKNDYSGMILFTDGEGDMPFIDKAASGRQILWILDSRNAFEKSRQQINALPHCSSTFLPF